MNLCESVVANPRRKRTKNKGPRQREGGMLGNGSNLRGWESSRSNGDSSCQRRRSEVCEFSIPRATAQTAMEHSQRDCLGGYLHLMSLGRRRSPPRVRRSSSCLPRSTRRSWTASRAARRLFQSLTVARIRSGTTLLREQRERRVVKTRFACTVGCIETVVCDALPDSVDTGGDLEMKRTRSLVSCSATQTTSFGG